MDQQSSIITEPSSGWMERPSVTIPRGRMNQFSLETQVEIFVLIWHQEKVEKSKIIDDLVFFERRFLWEIETHCWCAVVMTTVFRNGK